MIISFSTHSSAVVPSCVCDCTQVCEVYLHNSIGGVAVLANLKKDPAHFFLLCWISVTGFCCCFHSDRISPNRVAATCRSHVIYALPRLKCMDFSAVTPQERVMARYWHQGLQARRTTEDPDDL